VKCDREVVKRESELGCTRHEVDLLRKQAQDLTKRLELLRGVRRLELRGDMLAVKIIPHFTRESIVECFQRVSIKPGDIVLFEDASGGGPQTARMLIDRGVKAAIVDTPLSHLSEEALTKAAIPVIDAKLVELQRVDEFAFISRKKLENQLQDFMKEVREKARKAGEDQLVEMVERYKREVER
jgi:predicted RNase H-like nuclease (RuvC/YqgF family)